MKTLWSGICLALIPFVLSGCGGWQLRGAGVDSVVVSGYVYRSFDASAAMDAVAAELSRGGINAGDADTKQPRIELLSISENRRTVSVVNRSRTAQYELITTLRYRVLDAAGEILRPATALSERRDYFVDRDNIMGSSGEEAQLRGEMRTQLGLAVLRVIGRLATPSTPT